MYIGIDLGGTNIAGGVVTPDGIITERIKIKTNVRYGRDAILYGLREVCDILVEKIGKENVQGVGIGSPGMLDIGAGKILKCENLSPLDGVDITAGIREKWGVPVYIDNDANCAALGESYAGGAKGVKNAILVTLGTGVGGGIIIDRKIYSGFNGVAGEIGHFTIDFYGRECPCGRRGCWEAYASVPGLIFTTKTAMNHFRDSVMWQLVGWNIDAVGGRTAFEASRQGDNAGKRVVERYIKHLAIGIINLINIFEPEMLCIGGGLSNEGEYLLAPLRDAVDREKYTGKSPDVPQTVIKRAELGNDAGIIGAAMLGVTRG